MGQDIRTAARLLLAGIRLLNGAIALCAPELISRQLGTPPAARPVTQYALRMFGIRTILLALDLLRPAGPVRDQAIRLAPIVHGSDTIAATLAARSGTLPTRAATSIVAISAINTLLALVMQPPITRRSRQKP